MKELFDITACYRSTLKKILLLLFSIFIWAAAFTQQPITINFSNTIAMPPVTPYISDYISQGKVNSTITNNSAQSNAVYLFGVIKRISPSPFTITLKKSVPPESFTLKPGESRPLLLPWITAAFGNFNDPNALDLTNITLAEITDINNQGKIKLPDGNYNICFFTRSDIGCNGPNDCFSSNPNLGCSNNFIIGCGGQISTTVRLPVNPVIDRTISAGNVTSTIQIKNSSQCNTPVQVVLSGKIERISPSPFTISLNPQYASQQPVTMNTGPVPITVAQQRALFGDFAFNTLIITGIDPASVKDPSNKIKLPDGNYRICFNARYVNPNGSTGEPASDPNMGCGIFSICYNGGMAPQFTQPVNNLNINSELALLRPVSPVVFTWTPPQSTCGLSAGGYTYDFEIREILNGQTVTDAINNPLVFEKRSLPSTTFLLDTNLYKKVLQEGKKYAIRVRAVGSNINSPVEIDNYGYSRIEAFQYGNNMQYAPNVVTQNNIRELQDYVIPYKERKSGLWNYSNTANIKQAGGDTLVPVEEYIDFALTQNGTAYSSDAVELLLQLNPELTKVKKIKLGYTPILPVFPMVKENDRKNFAAEHQSNLEPDNMEKNKFLKYADTLINHKQSIPTNAGKLINDLVKYLSGVKTQVEAVDRVTINYMNAVLSEIIYEMRLYPQGLNKNQLNQLQNLVSAFMDLTAPSPNNAAFFHPSKNSLSLSSFPSDIINELTRKVPLANYAAIFGSGGLEYSPAAVMKQLLPFDVVVYRSSGVAPNKPVLDAPDLNSTYRVFYTLSILYNHKNPEVNAKIANHLASTAQVSLPSNIIFRFWTLNMLNHKMTKPLDVDLRGVLETFKKSESKKPSIILKVD